MTKVSVIIPVYNARDYIIPCVESLTNQSLEDIELLFVDDHGTDDSMEAVRQYAEGYSGKKTFRFLETASNAGPGVARNVGIDAAEGEYLAFVDSDDWVENDYCEALFKAAARRDADLAFCNLRKDNLRDGSSVELSNPEISSGSFSEKKRKAFLAQFEPCLSTFLYRRSFLIHNTLRFPEMRHGGEGSFLASCVLSAERVARVEKPLYHSVLRSRSFSTKVDPAKYLQTLEAYDAFLGFARQQGLYEKNKAEIDYLYIREAFLRAARDYIANEVKPDPGVLTGTLIPALEKQIPDYAANPYLRKKLGLRILIRWMARRPRLAMRRLKRQVKK